MLPTEYIVENSKLEARIVTDTVYKVGLCDFVIVNT